MPIAHFRSIIPSNMNAIRRLFILAGMLLAGFFLAGCGTQLIYPTSTPWPTRTPRPTQTTPPTATLTPSITPTPTEIVPSSAGTALPPSPPVIAPENAGQLALYGEWGSGIPLGVAFAPDGSTIAVASTRGLWLYDGVSAARIRNIDPGKTLRSVAYAPDGSLAAGSDDGVILIYAPDSAQPAHEIPAHRGPVFALAFSADGERLVSGGYDGSVRLWHPQEERQLMSFNGHRTPPRRISFSPDGETIYSWSPEDHLRIWPLSGRTPPEPIYLGVDARRKSGSSAGFSSSGEFLAIDQDTRVRLMFTRTGNARINLANFTLPVESVAAAPDGAHVATVDSGGIKIWNGQSGQLLVDFLTPPGAWSGTLLAFSPDGSRLASVGDALRVWSLDPPGGAAAQSQPVFQRGYRLFSRSAPDREALWNGLEGGQAQPVRLADGARLALVGRAQGEANAVAISADGSLAAAASADGSIQVWRIQDGEVTATLTGERQMAGQIAFSPDNTLLAAASGDAVLRVWDLTGSTLAAELQAPGPILQVSFSPDGAWLSGGSRKETYLWQAAGWQLKDTLPGRELVFSVDGQSSARFMDDSGGTQVVIANGTHQVTLPAVGSALAFSPAGDLLVVSGIDLSVYDPSSGEELFRIDSPAAYGRPVFSPDGRKLLLTASDGVVYVFAVP
jgi:WD40 repeat protein